MRLNPTAGDRGWPSSAAQNGPPAAADPIKCPFIYLKIPSVTFSLDLADSGTKTAGGSDPDDERDGEG
jgi:hypothetical protein